MNADKDSVENNFKEWVIAHGDNFPISAPFWDIELLEETNDLKSESPSKLIALGKYNAEVPFSKPFYKPFTKIFKI